MIKPHKHACAYVYESNVYQHYCSMLLLLVKEFKQSVNPMEPNIIDETFVGYIGNQAKKSQLLQVRLSLLRLLQDSELYDANQVLESLIAVEPLDIEKAIIYGRVNFFFFFITIIIIIKKRKINR